MKKRLFVIFLFVIFPLNFVLADFQIGNSSYLIDSQYGPSDSVRGWVNISFQNESASSVFSDSLGNSISLIDLLKLNTNYDYSCNTNGCMYDYLTNNPASTKSFSLGVGNSKVFGIKFNEEITAVNSINFVIESNAEQSCFNQLALDFLSDGIVDFGNTKSTLGDCSFSKTYGCFNEEISTSEYIIGKFPNKHCQKITLSESPSFNLGAWVNRGSDNRNLTMAFYDIYGSLIEGASCSLPNNNLTEELSCGVNYLVTESKEFYVCIHANTEGTSKIKGYSVAEGCGFYGVGVLDENAAFKIFAEGKKFDSVGSLNVTNSLPNGNTLGNYAEDYILEKYGDLSCSGGCVVPLNFISQKTQDINIKNLQVKYETSLGPTISTDFYEIEEAPSKINSDFQKLSLEEGNFTLPSDYGEYTFKLRLGDNELFAKKLTIEKLPVINYLTPTKTASAYPTIFKVNVDTPSNLSKYEWDFGDGQIQTTLENKVLHTYGDIGNYSLKVTITDVIGREGYREFEIIVDSPKEIINKTLVELQQNLINLNSQINEFPLFDQQSLREFLTLEIMEDKLKQAQRDEKSAVSEEDYNNLMTDILEIIIPRSILTSKSTAQISFYPEEEVIDVGVLAKIGGGDYDPEKEASYINGIFSWNQENTETKIKFTELSAKYSDYSEPILRFFELNIKKKDPNGRDAYIILEKLEGIKFMENYLDNEESGYIYFDLSNEEKTIVFSTTEEVDFINLPLFISPEIGRLPLIELINGEEKPVKWKLFIAVIILLLIIGVITYVILQEWYKRKYENYLFKNRNELYNIVNYIQNSRNKKIDDRKIATKLREAGWNLEQVTYAMRKYTGKRTGMFEIPVSKLSSLFKKMNYKKQPLEEPFP